MASPDATPYIDLRLLDVSTQDLFEAGLNNLISYLPDYVPREGHTEVLLMESLAIEVTEAVFAINRLPGALVEALLVLYGIERDPGSPPSGTFRFTVVDTAGYVIPAGTRIALPIDLAAEETLVFVTDAPLLVPAGSLTADVTATALANTIVANGTPAGAFIELIDSVAVAERVDLVSPIGGGAAVEDDMAWFTRGMQRFARLSETLVLPRHFTAAALEAAYVTRAFTIDNTQPGQAVGASAGHVTVAVYGVGAPVSAANRAALGLLLDQAAQANLAVHVVDPTLSVIDLDIGVVADAGYTNAAVANAVEVAVRAYLSPEQWGWGQTLYRNELISLIDQVPGVARVTSIASGGTEIGNVALSGVAPLAVAGTLTLNVTS